MLWQPDQNRIKKFLGAKNGPKAPPKGSASRFRKYPLSFEPIFFIFLTALVVTILVRYVDLAPHVDNDFFFSSEDPNYQADSQISQLFVRKDTQVILSVTGDIFAQDYQRNIRKLSELLSGIDGVRGIKSTTDGPRNVRDAARSPFWKRLLIAGNQGSTNILVIVGEKENPELMRKVREAANLFDKDDFRIRISGPPYIADLIRRNLQADLKTFSTLAFILFGLVIIFIFHSWRIFFGMIVACVNAAAITFMLNHLLHIRVGILTANLSTIIFVLTLSHIVFLTFNWKHVHLPATATYSSVDKAVRMTVWASFWCMLTTSLGFLSLLFVPAKPLRELGIAGALGTVVAFTVVYTIFPAFLRLKENSELRSGHHMKHFYEKLYAGLKSGHTAIVVIILAVIALTAPSLWKLNTDPSLFAYFSENSEIHQGLEYIDQNGGSSPLVIAVRSASGMTLNSRKAYRELWALNEGLEQHPAVGTIISLPTLMAEGKRSPFSFFIVWEWYLKALEKPKYDRIADSFVTRDRQYGLFLLRMKESGRTKHRLQIVEELKSIVQKNGFVPHLVGGVYPLQGQLARLVAQSLIYAMGQLIAIFAFIALLAGRSLRISLAMTASITVIPMMILGLIGYFHIPLDTISAPAANVALGMGIDAMIHMVNIFHRSKEMGTSNTAHWDDVTRRMAQPILTSMFIVCTGFGIFFFSSFPPTHRFGGSIILGSVVSAFTALFVFPLLAKKRGGVIGESSKDKIFKPAIESRP